MSKSFADLGVSDAVCAALSERGITAPFAVQQLIVGDLLAGHDVLAQAPTGSGKTLGFGIPMVERLDANRAGRPGALVLAPTRELATQIVDELYPLAHARALRISAVYGGVGLVKQERAAAVSHIVVATPGRLEDLLQRGTVTLSGVRILVLDEADRMLDMGFRPAVDRIVDRCSRERQTVFLSATLEGEAGRLADVYTRDAIRHAVRPQAGRLMSIEHRFVAVEPDERIERLVTELEADRDLALVFVRTKHGADRLVKRLDRAGVRAVAMHGDKSQRQRERALSAFERGEVTTLVATDVAARGIDVRGISHVINFDVPQDSDTYTHRVGRTGRAGRTGAGITFVDRENLRDVRAMAKALGIDDALPAGAGAGPRPGASAGAGARPGASEARRGRRRR